MICEPIISIIVPCYNQALFLDDCLKSVKNQIFQNWECIIINDGSTDNTSKIAKKWVIKESRFIYIEQKNLGLSNARNAGIKIAKGKYILFLDSDDIILPNKLSKSIDVIRKEGTDVAITNFVRLRGKSNKTKPAFCNLKKEYFTYENILLKWDSVFTYPPHCILISKNVLGNKEFNERLKAKEDWVMWLNIFRDNPKVSYIDEVLVYYRVHSKNMTKDSNHMIVNLEKSISEILTDINSEYLNDFVKKGVSDRLREISYLKNKINKYKRLRNFLFIVLLTSLIANIILAIFYFNK